MSIGVLVLVGVIHWRLISVYNRFDQFGNFFNNRQEIEELMRANKLDYAQYNSTTSRYAMWKCSAHLITENIFSGVGTGDIKDELVKEYEKTGFKKGVILHYNPHNQYLHTTVALGIIGLSFLLCLFAFALLTSIRQKNYLFAGLLAIIILNALTESVLEVQSGIIFFSVFYCFFMNDIYRKKMLAKEE
jgi:O-antigen ligase